MFYLLTAVAILASSAFAQTPSLLVLSKSDHTVSIVDPASLQVVARLPSGPDPHEIIASDDGKLAYISNYGGLDSTLNTISVVDLVARKAMPPIDLGAIRSTHGLHSPTASSTSPPKPTKSSAATIPQLSA